ncbi:MAG: hypothetical protein K0R65_3045 [Crocinitomicaceae bacterium]|jgi:hypothetical protein|nr:hypothetical protein [Crocinitomicaceae bacterium]
MKPRFLICCFFSVVFSYGQDSLRQLNIGVRMNRLDFFTEASVLFPGNTIRQELGLGFGINRTVFQQRAFPEVFYGLRSNFKSRGIFFCQGTANYQLSFFQVNKQQSELHFFNEILLGTHMGIGRKYAFFFQPQIGFQAETFHSDFFKRVETGFSFAYSAKIGISHAF